MAEKPAGVLQRSIPPFEDAVASSSEKNYHIALSVPPQPLSGETEQKQAQLISQGIKESRQW